MSGLDVIKAERRRKTFAVAHRIVDMNIDAVFVAISRLGTIPKLIRHLKLAVLIKSDTAAGIVIIDNGKNIRIFYAPLPQKLFNRSLRTAADNMNFISAAQRFVGKNLEIFGIIGNNPMENRDRFSAYLRLSLPPPNKLENRSFSELGLKADSGLILIFGSDMLPVMV